jgi:hypothetical protein
MAEDKDVTITVTDPARPDAPPRGRKALKLTRSASDGSTYLIPLPGLAPDGLHISQHPSGELHIRTPDRKVDARLDVMAIAAAALSGQLDESFAELLGPPPSGRAAEVTLLPMSRVPPPDPNRRHETVPLEPYLGSGMVIVLDDTAEMAALIHALASDGTLRVGDCLRIDLSGSDDEISIFRYVGKVPIEGAAADVPPQFARFHAAIMRGLRDYQGLFVTYTERVFSQLEKSMPGMKDFAAGLEKMETAAGGPAEMERRSAMLLDTFRDAAVNLGNRKRLKFDPASRSLIPE